MRTDRPRRWLPASILLLLAGLHACLGARLQADEPPRPLPPEGLRFVDPAQGADEHAGTLAAPWRTVGHALTQLSPGETLCLRAGVYYERLRISLAGRAAAPITIRGYPGERAVLDGGWREFAESPAEAWRPASDGAAGEYESVQRYPNVREVLGSFQDSGIGLQTYYHSQDLRATNELVDWEDWDQQDATDIRPLYCGPGIWYDHGSGRIRARLASTHLPAPLPNYQGESDPRRVPLSLAPFHAIPLHVDGGAHLRLQDLEIRGAGYTAVLLEQAEDIEFDRVRIRSGAYGIRAQGTGPLRLTYCQLQGNVAPWTFRSDGSKRDYPGRPHRNISRLNTHALIEIDAGRESSVYAFPQNDAWELDHCEFTDAHDAVYLGAINVRFHHNLVANMQDDGLYLSPMYQRHRLDGRDPRIEVTENTFRGVLTAIAFGGPEPGTHDQVFIARNVFDLRRPIPTGRPTARVAEPALHHGKVIGDHGSPPWPAIAFYHNTVLSREPARDAAMATTGASREGHPRRVLNNIFLHEARLPALSPLDAERDVAADGNLYWSLADIGPGAKLFDRFRASPQFEASRKLLPDGSTTHSLVADPRLRSLADDGALDVGLVDGSPAIDAGVPIPDDWPDPLRDADPGAPDIGAHPRE